MTPLQRRVTVAVFIMVLLSLLVSAGLTFIVEPISAEFGLTDDSVTKGLAVPAIASLLVIFIAGQLGDQFGHRRTLLVASAGFSLGGLIMAISHGPIPLAIGLALCGATATVMQIVAVGLLQQTVPEGEAHVSAFTTYGMVFPLAFLVFPLATAGALEFANWRLIPIIWAVGGVVIALVAKFALEHRKPTRPGTEWITPVLAGLTLTAIVRTLNLLGRHGTMSPLEIVLLVLGVLAGGVCYIMSRRNDNSSFSLRPIRNATLFVLLLGVAIVALVSILVYLTIAIDSMFHLSAIQTAIVTAPAQLGAVLGAKILAGKAIAQWGIARAGRGLLLALALSMLTLVLIQPTSQLWFFIACATIISALGAAAITVFNTDVMARAPHNNTGPMSSFRGAASAIGTALGVVVIGSGVLSAANVQPGTDAATSDQPEQLAAALRLDGILGCAVALLGWAALVVVSRRTSTRSASPVPTH